MSLKPPNAEVTLGQYRMSSHPHPYHIFIGLMLLKYIQNSDDRILLIFALTVVKFFQYIDICKGKTPQFSRRGPDVQKLPLTPI